jgi:hypothetical protein
MIVTLPMEIALYRKGFKQTYLILSIGRYFTLLCMVVDLAINIINGATLESCHSIRWVLPFLSTAIQFVTIPLLLLRTYAVWGRNQMMGFFLVLLWFTPLIIGSYVATTYEGIPYSLFLNLNVAGGCGNDPTSNWGTAPFVVNMIVDSTVFLLTLGRLVFTLNASAVGGSTIRKILIRDGIMYYIVMVLINVINIVFFLAPGLPPLARPLIATPATMAPPIIIGRLFFNLQNNFLSSTPAPSHLSSSANFHLKNTGNTSIGSATLHSRTETYAMAPVVNYTVDVSSDNQSFLNTRGGMVPVKGSSFV